MKIPCKSNTTKLKLLDSLLQEIAHRALVCWWNCWWSPWHLLVMDHWSEYSSLVFSSKDTAISRAGHFLTKVKKSTGTVWISFTNTSSSTKKKELGLYLISKPNRKNCHILPQNTKEKWHFQFFWSSYIKIMSKIIFDFTYQNVWSRRLIWYPYCHTFVTFNDRHKCHNMT